MMWNNRRCPYMIILISILYLLLFFHFVLDIHLHLVHLFKVFNEISIHRVVIRAVWVLILLLILLWGCLFILMHTEMLSFINCKIVDFADISWNLVWCLKITSVVCALPLWMYTSTFLMFTNLHIHVFHALTWSSSLILCNRSSSTWSIFFCLIYAINYNSIFVF